MRKVRRVFETAGKHYCVNTVDVMAASSTYDRPLYGIPTISLFRMNATLFDGPRTAQHT